MQEVLVRFAPPGREDHTDASCVEKAGRLNDLFGCHETGLLFHMCDAELKVYPPVYADARTFHCPVCETALNIRTNGELPIATCSSCAFVTDPDNVSSILDLLTFEANPFPNAQAEFDNLRKIAAGARSPVYALHEDLNFAFVASEKPKIAQFCLDQHRKEAIQNETFCEVEDFLDLQKNVHRLSLARFRDVIHVGTTSPREDKLESGTLFRSSLPPWRMKTKATFDLFSPFTSKSVLPPNFEGSLVEASANAAYFMPSITAECALCPDNAQLTLKIRNVEANAGVLVSFHNLEWLGTDDFVSRIEHDKKELAVGPSETKSYVLKVEKHSTQDSRGKMVAIEETVQFQPVVGTERASYRTTTNSWRCWLFIEIPCPPIRI